MTVTVIGAGLAGVEAAYTLSRNGINVKLHEMKPHKYSPAHKSEGFAELVCSNSLKSDLSGAAALLKAEMRMLGSLTLQVAELTKVPAGGALAVDRDAFSKEITRRIEAEPNIEIVYGEVTDFPDSNAIIATGPLTSDDFSKAIFERLSAVGELGTQALCFYDAAAPIVTADSMDMNIAFAASRYGKGTPDYLNCPFTKEEYETFYNALVTAETAELHDIDKVKPNFYEGCMPVEVLAKRGIDSLRFGCMKPVGLGERGNRPYAIVQLRKENSSGSMYNIVGFQTNLKFAEQKRVFSLIPGLSQAEFVRYGVMHRNTFIDSPRLLDSNFKLRNSDNIYFAGQITGVEGYMESAASGIVVAQSLCRELVLPDTTMLGALTKYISDESVTDFQPMGANMGLLPPLGETIKGKQERYARLTQRALEDLTKTLKANT